MSYGNRNRGYGSGGSSYGGGNRDRYGGGGSSMNQGPKPVEAGKEYDVEVTEISRRGDGVAKIQGYIIFVKGAKIGDKVKIKVETVGPRFATATALQTSGKTDSTTSSEDSSSEAEPSTM
jgi:predicted RNA-binding protein with TRAM domain